MDNYQLRNINGRWYVFVSNDNYTFAIPGDHASIEAAETAYRTWKTLEDDKNNYRNEFDLGATTWG